MANLLSVDLALATGIWFFGFLALNILLPRPNWLVAVALGFPLGAGSLTWLQFLISWVGVPLDRLSVIGLLAGLIAAALLVKILKWQRSTATGSRSPIKWRGTRSVVWLTALLLALAGGFIYRAFDVSLGSSYSSWDAMAIWGAKGYGIAFEGTVLAARRWGALGLAYPLNVPLLISDFRILSGDVVPGSKLIFPLFGTSLLAICVAYWRGHGMETRLAVLGALILGSSPVVFEQTTNGYANLALTTYLIGGFVLGLEGIEQASVRKQLVSGVLYGLACWTRAEGILYVAALMLATWVAARFTATGKVKSEGSLAPIGLIVVPWVAFSFAHGSLGTSLLATAVTEAGSQLAQGKLNFGAIYQIARFFGRMTPDPRVWGFVFPLSLIVLLVRRAEIIRGRQFEILAPLFSAAGALAVVVSMYYISSFRDYPTLIDFLYMAFNRSLLPVPFLLMLVSLNLFGDRDPRSSSAQLASHLARARTPVVRPARQPVEGDLA